MCPNCVVTCYQIPNHSSRIIVSPNGFSDFSDHRRQETQLPIPRTIVNISGTICYRNGYQNHILTIAVDTLALRARSYTLKILGASALRSINKLTKHYQDYVCKNHIEISNEHSRKIQERRCRRLCQSRAPWCTLLHRTWEVWWCSLGWSSGSWSSSSRPENGFLAS